MTDQELLDVRAAAARLHVSRSYLYQLADSKTIEHVRIGRRLLFAPAQLEAFIAANTVKVAPAAAGQAGARPQLRLARGTRS